MKITFTWIPVLMMLLLGAFPGHAAGWQMKDMGVGIFDDAAYDRELRIVEKRASNTWSIKELYGRGAFRGNGKIFGVWLVGPPVSTYLDKNGLAEYSYKIRLTDPKGSSAVHGPYGFYLPGHATSFINAGLPGKWRVDFMIWQRSTKQDTPIGSLEFTITEENPAKPVLAGWQMKDMGVGIFDDAAYDRELRIVEKRASNTWSIKELYERGAFRGNGKIFGVWLVGPPVSAYLDKNGLAQYDYKVRLTDPKGNSVVYGPYGFYPPGHATSFINAGIPGKWRADFMIRQRDTKGDAPIGAIEFTITD